MSGETAGRACSEPHPADYRCFDCATDDELAAAIPPFPGAAQQPQPAPDLNVAEYIRANQELARSLDEATRRWHDASGPAASAAVNEMREHHGLAEL